MCPEAAALLSQGAEQLKVGSTATRPLSAAIATSCRTWDAHGCRLGAWGSSLDIRLQVGCMGWQPGHRGLQPRHAGLQPVHVGLQPPPHQHARRAAAVVGLLRRAHEVWGCEEQRAVDVQQPRLAALTTVGCRVLDGRLGRMPVLPPQCPPAAAVELQAGQWRWRVRRGGTGGGG